MFVDATDVKGTFLNGDRERYARRSKVAADVAIDVFVKEFVKRSNATIAVSPAKQS